MARGNHEITEEQIDEAERILSYYECHSDNARACEFVLQDSVKLLRDILPDDSAYKTANEEN